VEERPFEGRVVSLQNRMALASEGGGETLNKRTSRMGHQTEIEEVDHASREKDLCCSSKFAVSFQFTAFADMRWVHTGAGCPTSGRFCQKWGFA